MKELISIVRCIVPFFVVSAMLYPIMSIVGGSWDAFMWDRADRMFYFICCGVFGWALMLRVLHVSGEVV